MCERVTGIFRAYTRHSSNGLTVKKSVACLRLILLHQVEGIPMMKKDQLMPSAKMESVWKTTQNSGLTS